MHRIPLTTCSTSKRPVFVLFSFLLLFILAFTSKVFLRALSPANIDKSQKSYRSLMEILLLRGICCSNRGEPLREEDGEANFFNLLTKGTFSLRFLHKNYWLINMLRLRDLRLITG